MTRDQMIRDLKLWAEQVAQLTGEERETSLSESSGKARRTAR